MIQELKTLLSDFEKIGKLCGYSINTKSILYENLPAPHKSANLPHGAAAVYMFSIPSSHEFLKIGFVNENSNARFKFHHYNPNSSNSNLAKSLLNDDKFWNINSIQKQNENTIGDWIKNNIDRDNLFLFDNQYPHLMKLLEFFFHCRLNPRYEG